MQRRYFTLLLRDAVYLPYAAAFGDYSRAVVDQERRDSYAGISRKLWAIIETTDNQRDIDNMVHVANGEHVKVETGSMTGLPVDRH